MGPDLFLAILAIEVNSTDDSRYRVEMFTPAQARSRRAAAASNDNSAWHEVPFRLKKAAS